MIFSSLQKKLGSNLRSLLIYSVACVAIQAAEMLPQSITFIGQKKFQEITYKAVTENWRLLPMGERMAKITLELKGVPYKAYTLEIHDKIIC